MDLKKILLDLIQKTGMFNMVVELLIKTLGDTIDTNELAEAITDKIASGGNLYEVIEAYVTRTEDVSDDDLPERVESIVNSFKNSIDKIDNGPLIDAILSIEFDGKTIGDMKVPDLDSDNENNYTVRELLIKVLK